MLGTLNNTDLPKLISFPICPFVQRSSILLEYKNQPYERINIDLANKPDWFLALSPLARVPTLVVSRGEKGVAALFESSVINEYLDEAYGKPLLNGDSLSKAHSRAWVAYSEALIMQQYALMLEQNEELFQVKLDAFLAALKKIKPAEGKAYFNGESFGLVDASVAPVFTRLQWLPQLLGVLKTEAKTDKHSTYLLGWIDSLVSHIAVQNSVAGDFDAHFIDYFKKRNSVAIQRWEDLCTADGCT